MSGAAAPSFADFMVAFMTYFLLCYQFIPISLYVSLATVQMITRYFVVQDVCCYDEEADEPCQVPEPEPQPEPELEPEPEPEPWPETLARNPGPKPWPEPEPRPEPEPEPEP